MMTSAHADVRVVFASGARTDNDAPPLGLSGVDRDSDQTFVVYVEQRDAKRSGLVRLVGVNPNSTT